MVNDGPVILVATDRSAGGDRCLAPAVRLALGLGGRVVLLHVVSDPMLAPALSSNVAQDALDARSALEAKAREHKGCAIAVDVRSGESVVDTILHAAEEHGAGFLLVATQGKSAFQRFRLGSVAEGLVRRSPIPVIVLPATGA